MDTGAELARARGLALQGRTEEALAVVDAVLDDQPEHVPAIRAKAELLSQAGAAESALALHERAARLAPRSVEALNDWARALHELGRCEEALGPALQARELLADPAAAAQAPAVYLTLLWCYRELRRYQEALAAAEEGLARTPDAVLAEWATVVEQELAHAERERC
jgi:tetratricopeptide (TPR) repeat protein